MSSNLNTNSIASKSFDQKVSHISAAFENLKYPKSKMEAFLESVATIAYGPILGKIEGYIKKRLEEYDKFIRAKSDRLGILVRENREADQAAIQELMEFFGRLGAGLKRKMKYFTLSHILTATSHPFSLLLGFPTCIHEILLAYICVTRNSAQRIAGALLTPQAFSYSGHGQHVGFQETLESLALIRELEVELDTYLKWNLRDCMVK